jgi:hypothetical protein
MGKKWKFSEINNSAKSLSDMPDTRDVTSETNSFGLTIVLMESFYFG